MQPKKQKSGRNNQGRITTRHRGGGHKKHYRLIDFKRTKDGIPAKVETIEYDPNRSANIALVLYADGERKYIISERKIIQEGFGFLDSPWTGPGILDSHWTDSDRFGQDQVGAFSVKFARFGVEPIFRKIET